MQLLGYSVSGLLAFGGIGGIAVGFAAKDLLANFFGGLMIYLDRPFSVGDWIRSPDKEIEGTVEDVGWRLTRIRTFDKRPLYIPNSVFASISVENPSRMTNRRIYETVGIRYCDMDSMNNIVQQVTQMLKDHDAIDNNQTMIVNFNKFSDSSLDFFIYTFTKTTDWIEFHSVKQDVLLQIAEIIEKNGSEIAFPTSSIHLESAPESVIREN
jgi:MscS family membrane protein